MLDIENFYDIQVPGAHMLFGEAIGASRKAIQVATKEFHRPEHRSGSANTLIKENISRNTTRKSALRGSVQRCFAHFT